MQKMTNWEELEWRGLVKDVAGADIQEKINNVVKEYPGYEIFSVSSSRLHIKTFIFLRKKK